MPAIFNEKTKETVRTKLLENGFALIKKYGYKKMTIQDITKATGLAKGTFYTFFPSKEEFVFQIMQHNRMIVKKRYIDMYETNGSLDRDQVRSYFLKMRNEETNIYPYLTDEDIAHLHARWPADHTKSEETDEQVSTWMLSHMKDVRPECDWRVFANCMKIMALMDMNKELLHQSAYDDTLKLYREALLDYIFG